MQTNQQLFPSPRMYAGGKKLDDMNPNFTSPELYFTATGQTQFQLQAAHGLGVVPRLFKAILIVKQATANFNVGDVIPAEYLANTNDLFCVVVCADATNLTIALIEPWGGNDWQVVDKLGNEGALICPGPLTQIAIKFYAWI